VRNCCMVQNVNRQLSEVLRAELGIVNFRKIEKIYDEQTQIYLENLPLIEDCGKSQHNFKDGCA